MTSDQVAGIVRAVVSAIGGYFIGRGVTDASTVTAVAGAAATIATAIWSVMAKKPPAA